MKSAGRLKSAIAGASLAAMVLTTGGVVMASQAMATQTMTSTAWVNLRAGAGTSYTILAVLSPSETVTATGNVSGGWTEVTTAKGIKGWVSTNYLQAAATSTAPATSGSTVSASGTATAISAVNIRTAPSTASTVVGVLAQGASIPTTGKTSGGWTEVVHRGVARWISTSYLTTGTAQNLVGTTPTITGQVRTTANVYLRSGGTINDPYSTVVPANTVVDTTGDKTASYTEVVYQGTEGWIATSYTAALTSGPTAPAAPTTTGTVYVNVGALNVRSEPSTSSTIVGTLSRGAALATTGQSTDAWVQVSYQGAARWVYKAYTSTTKPSTTTTGSYPGITTSGMSQLTPSAKAVVDAVVANFPKITTIYGWRASSAISTSDHPYGRAVDVMVSNYRSAEMIAYGDAIAQYFITNASKHNISYIIWRQKLWNAAYPTRGWRAMEDRGGDTANHYDHVHISVKS